MNADWFRTHLPAWFATNDVNEFMAIREEVLLAFMDVVEGAGASFPLPSRLVYTRPSAREAWRPGATG